MMGLSGLTHMQNTRVETEENLTMFIKEETHRVIWTGSGTGPGLVSQTSEGMRV